MGFLAGLVWGLVIAAATVALEHYGPSSEPLHISLSGNGAIAAPIVLVPLAIFWGWSGIANAYAGRSVVPIATYTLALLLGVSAIGPADAFFFPQGGTQISVNDLLGGLFQGSLFVGFVAVIAAPIYWVLRSRNGWRRWRRCLGRWRYVAPRERGARRAELTRGTEGWTLRLGRRWAASHRARLRRHEPTDVVGGVRQHRHQASPLEGGRQHALML